MKLPENLVLCFSKSNTENEIQVSQVKIKTIIWAFPYGSGFPLQSFAKIKRISTTIPSAKRSGVRSSLI